MGLVTKLVFLIASVAGLPTGRDSQNAPVYRVAGPAQVLVEYGPGYTASAVQPQLFLRTLQPIDPTASLVCRDLPTNYTVFFIPQHSLKSFLKSPLSKTVSLKEELTGHSDKMPWIIFLKKENTFELPDYFMKINLKSGSPDDPWELGAYAIAEESEDYEYPDVALSTPPPFFPSLCVSLDKPRPFPVLFAPSTQPATLPSLASYSAADLTPSVPVNTVLPAPAPVMGTVAVPVHTFQPAAVIVRAPPPSFPQADVVVPVPSVQPAQRYSPADVAAIYAYLPFISPSTLDVFAPKQYYFLNIHYA